MRLINVRGATINQHQTRLSFGTVVDNETVAFASAAHVECEDHFFSSDRLDTLEGPQHVEHAVALEAALATQIGRALAEDVFDPAWLTNQLVVASHQHRRRSANVRRGHAWA